MWTWKPGGGVEWDVVTVTNPSISSRSSLYQNVQGLPCLPRIVSQEPAGLSEKRRAFEETSVLWL